VKKKLTVIPPHKQRDKNMRSGEKLSRVAAYCRVSTILEQQENSYRMRVTRKSYQVQITFPFLFVNCVKTKKLECQNSSINSTNI
jgi:hypothetical protein